MIDARAPAAAAALAFLASTSIQLHARAADPAEHRVVELHVVTCDPATFEAVRNHLAIDLGVQVEADASTKTRATVTCADGSATVQVHDPITQKDLSRTVRIVDQKSRARLLAIATSELIFASWIELTRNAPLRVEADGPPASAEDTQGARDLVHASAVPIDREATREGARREEDLRPRLRNPRDQNAIIFFASGRGAIDLGAPLFGVGGRWVHHTRGPVTFSIELAGESASIDTTLGNVGATVVSSFAAAFYGVGRRHLHARFGVGLRGGYAALEGSPDRKDVASGERLSGALLGAAAAAGIEWRSARFVFDLAGDFGSGFVPLKGTVRDETFKLGGWNGAISLGAGAAF